MLELINIVKTYKTENFIQNAVDDVSVKFYKGELTAILGESGSGKSTLLNILSGLDKPTSGTIKIDGVDTSKFNKTDWATYRNHYIGFVFQEYNLINNLTVLENVEMPLLLQGISQKEAKKRALEKLSLVGLSDQVSKLPIQLSGGQCQRVSIARALVTEPKVIMADEPTGALDYELGMKTINFIKQICKDKIIILVTHDTELASKYADRILEMKDGKIISDTKSAIDNQDELDTFDLKKPKMSLKMSFKLAFKNIQSRILRTIFTSITVSIGLVCVFLLVFLTTGINKTLDNVLTKMFPTNLYVVKGEYQSQIITEENINSIKNIEGVNEVMPTYSEIFNYRLDTGSNYESYKNFFFTNLPNNELNFGNKTVYGKYPTEKNEVLVSKNFAESYFENTKIKTEEDFLYILERLKSDEIYISNSYDGESKTKMVKICGIVDEGLLSISETMYALTDTIIEFIDEEPTVINVYVDNINDKITENVERSLNDLGFIYQNSYKTASKSISDFFDNALKIMIFASIGSLIVAGILIALIIYTSIVERTREIGILNALGAKGRNIASIFVFESMIIGFISAVFGFAVAFLLSKIGNSLFSNLLRSLIETLLNGMTIQVDVFRVNPLWVLAVTIFCIFYTCLIGILPAIKAAKMNAVNALRKE